MPEGSRRLAAIMFTDMVGFTSLAQTNEDLSLTLLEKQRTLVRDSLRSHNGREVKTMGDAFLVEFPSALDAVRCAYDIQTAARELNDGLPEERRIALRIGIHLGDVVVSGEDITGDAVNVASRIEPLSESGGICISRQVYDHIRNKVDFQLSSMGEKKLKNVDQTLEVFRVVMPWSTQFGPATTSLDKKRIAVLPFSNISPDPNDEYFADGMTEEVIATMSRISGLKVIARTSVMGYKGGQKKISDVARELEVGSVLEGSVRKAGDRARVTVQLIDSETSEHVWAESYDREVKDILAIQSDISRAVADTLRVKLLKQEKSVIESNRTVDARAYTLYLKGMYYWNERTKEATLKAMKYFEESIRVDPRSAPAYSGLALCYTVATNYAWISPEEAQPKAREYSVKAVQLDDNLAEAHASLGDTMIEHSWEFLGGIEELKRALEIRPNYAQAYHWLALTSMYIRRFDDAVKYQERAYEIDPNSRLVDMGMAVVRVVRGDYELAEKRLERLANEYPQSSTIRFWKAMTHLGLNQPEMAVREAEKALELEDSSFLRLNLAWVCAEIGDKVRARRLLHETMARKRDDYLRPSQIGEVLLALGENEEAFVWLDRAINEKDTAILFSMAGELYKKYRVVPGWKEMDARLGLPK